MAQRSLSSILTACLLSLLTINPAYSQTTPVISDVNTSKLTSRSATVTWETSQPARCQIQYGETTSYGNVTSDSESLTTRHEVTIPRLKQLTSYHYRIIARDRYGAAAISEDFTFTTKEGRSSRDSTSTSNLVADFATPLPSATLIQPPDEETVLSATQTPEASQVLSISIAPNAWNIGEVKVGTTTTMSEADKVTVTNNGDGIEDFTLTLVNPEQWLANSQPGAERFVLNAAFSQDPDNIIWDEDNHLVTTEPTLSTGERFAGDQNGVGVLPGESRGLFLQFKSPTQTKIVDSELIRLIVSCEVPKN